MTQAARADKTNYQGKHRSPVENSVDDTERRRIDEIRRRGAQKTLEAIYRRFPHLKETSS